MGRLGFAQPLKIPPLAEPRLDHDGRKVFDLRLQPGTTELTPARLAKTWGVNDAYLGRVSKVGVFCEMVPAWDEGT